MKHVTVVVNLMLIVLLTHALAGISWKWMPTPRLPPPPAVMPTGPGLEGARKPSTPLRHIARWHLFGKAPVLGQAPPLPAVIPETKLNLVLRGVMASDDQGSSGAIIAEPNGAENFYLAGAHLPGGAVLKEIHPDRIVLMRNNRFETLHLPKEELKFIGQPQARGGGGLIIEGAAGSA